MNLKFFGHLKINKGSVGFKIGLIIIFTSLVTMIVSIIGITRIRDMNNLANVIFHDNTTVLFPLSDAQQAMYTSQMYATQMVLDNNTDAISEFYSEINNTTGQLNNLKAYISRDLLSEYNKVCNEYNQAAMDLYNETSRSGPDTTKYYKTFHEKTKSALDYLYLINRKSRIIGQETYDQGKRIYSSVILLQTIITIIGVLFSIGLALLVSFSIITPLKKLRRTTEKLATGDLQAKVEVLSSDEIGAVGTAYNNAIDELRMIVGDAAIYAQNINSSSNEMFKVVDETIRSLSELNKLVEDLAKGATNQTNTVNFAVQTIQNAGDGIAKVSQASSTIYETCREASEEAKRGGTANETIMNTISGFIERVIGIETTVGDLAKDLQQIQDIVDAIRQISEQTTLLSLNASIEAARAGEQGRGFAVVATSIGKLAAQSQESVAYIDEVIARISAKTATTVESVTKSTAEIELTRNSLTESLDIFKKLVNRVNQITTELNNITVITDDVKDNTQVIISEMNKVATISEDNLAATEEVAATFEQQYSSAEMLNHAARELQSMAQKLTAAAEKFKLS
jgi:methyl-accepting chemotaxis protein